MFLVQEGQLGARPVDMDSAVGRTVRGWRDAFAGAGELICRFWERAGMR